MNCSAIRGFNYQPSYAATSLEIWALKFDPGRIEADGALRAGHGIINDF